MRPGRRRAVGWGAAVAGAALVAWLALHRPAGGAADGFVVASPSLFTAPGVRVAPSPEPPASRLDPEAPGAHGQEAYQVCGGAWLQAGADGTPDTGLAKFETDIDSMRAGAIERLRAARDGYARAVAVWMAADEAALVQLALGTNDPRIYALAFQTCGRAAAGSACSLLNARQWARLDPGNAAPWLYAFGEAKQRKDAAGVDEALFQIGQAQRQESRIFLPLLPVLDAAPPGDASLLATQGLAVQMIGKMVATVIPDLGGLLGACRGPALADANRRQVCERVASLLGERSDDLLTQNIGARMISEVTGSADRYALLRAERDAYFADQTPVTQDADPLGCGTLRRILDRLRQQALIGEVGVVRRWVAQSGLTPKELLARPAAAAASAVLAPDAVAAPAPASAP